MGALLQVAGLSVTFGGIRAVDDLSFTVDPGSILALIGPNGAGKTTTFHAISGVHRASGGSIVFDGRDVLAMSPAGRNRCGIARTFQITQPFQELTVIENVMVGVVRYAASVAQARKLALEYVDAVGLGERRDVLAKGLSTGQRKRLEMARAMATRPKMLLLDEVTGGVDQKSIPGLIDLVKKIKASGIALVIIEHNMRVIQELADRAVFMNRGKSLAQGTVQYVTSRPEVVELYLGEAAHA